MKGTAGNAAGVLGVDECEPLSLCSRFLVGSVGLISVPVCLGRVRACNC